MGNDNGATTRTNTPINSGPQATRSTRPRFVNKNIPNKMTQADGLVQVNNAPQTRSDVAIIGASGRYPMADNLSEFWQNLVAGKNCVTEIPAQRWNYHDYFSEDKNALGSIHSKWGGFVNDVDKFDPLFFNMSPMEAELIDPQERLFLQTAWNTIEDAAYTQAQLAGKKIGVYVGVMYGEYQLFGSSERAKGQPLIPGAPYASIANRVSYFFDFQGPSLALDSMCSSSITALHLGVECLSLIRICSCRRSLKMNFR